MRFVWLFLAVLLLIACGGQDPNTPQAKRQLIFNSMLHSSEQLGGMLRGRIAFDPHLLITSAEQLDQYARQPWQYFAQPDAGEESVARPEVWRLHEEFLGVAKDLEVQTAQLLAITKIQPLNLTKIGTAHAQVEAACAACHKRFREY